MSRLRRILPILWPSFLAAILAEGGFFSIVDPHLLIARHETLALSPLAVYSSGFFFFWVMCAVASGLTSYLLITPVAVPPE